MNHFRTYILFIAVLFYTLLFGQANLVSGSYTQMYENQKNGTAITQNIEEKPLTIKEQVDSIIEKMMNDPVMRNANWGFVVYDPQTKKIINSYNETSAFIPASTTKLITTETALALLGGKFHWITQLDYSGEIDENGILNGNLYIVGSGDPSLGTRKAGAASYTEIISDFISAISNRGIKKINGNIIIQTGVFKENKSDRLPENIVWLEVGNYYLPVGNTKDTDPKNERNVIKQKSPFETEYKRYFYISPNTGKMVFSEEFSSQGIDMKVPDAPSFLAKSLKETMMKRGISISGGILTKLLDETPETRLTITAYKSPTLSEIVYDTNQRSDNALAEGLLRAVGFHKYGNQNAETGKMVVMEHLKHIGFEIDELYYADGSGLSRSHRITPISQVKYLSDLMKKLHYKDFYNSLPIAGQTGTLKSSFKGQAYGQILAKTGTLNKVKTLAGYIKTQSGKTLVFSLLINNYSGSVGQVKSRMEEILSPLVGM